MNDLTLMVIKLAFLAVLWLFVIMAVGVIRTDMFGPAKGGSRAKRSDKPRREPKPKPKAKPRGGRNEPSHLVVTKGPLTGTKLNLGPNPILIGRGQDATLVINDDYASGRHARIYSDSGRWLVEDLGSRNGTYLGQQQVTQAVAVSIGQPIRIGKTVLELRK